MILRHLKAFAARSGLYTFAVGIEALVPFALLPILTRMLAPADYGVWVIFVAFYSFLRPIVSLNLQEAVRSRYLGLDAQGLNSLIVGALVASTCMTVVVEGAMHATRHSVSALIHFPSDWIWAAPATAYVYGIFYLFLAVFQFNGEVKKFIRFQFLQAGLGLMLVLAMLTGGLDWRGAVLGRLLGVIIAVGLAWPHIVRVFTFTFTSGIQWRVLLEFGFKYLPAGLGIVIVPLTNRLFVAHHTGVEEAGFLGIAGLFAAALSLLTTGYIYAWQPKLFRVLHGGSTPAERSEVFAFYVLFALLFPLGGYVFIHVSTFALPFLVPPAYLAAIPMISLSIWGGVAQAYFDQSQTILLGEKREWEMSLSYILVMALHVLLCSYWVHVEGSAGALKATLCAFLAGAGVSTIFAFASFRRALRSTS